VKARAALAVLLLAAILPSGAAAEALRDRPHCQQDLFCLAARADGETVLLELDIDTDLPLTLAVHLETRNIEGDAGPLHLTLEGPGRRALARFRIAAPGAWSLAFDYTFHPGTTLARHDPDAVYRLPWPAGERHRVIQGAEGTLSHRGPLANAVDWALPAGTRVLAARDGTVVAVRDGAEAGGPDPALQGRENFVWLRHTDGTVGQYLHLLAGSVVVAPGETVAAGREIGRSGASGFSTEPHLHFHVSSPTPEGPDAFESFPLRFDLGDGRTGGMEAGRRYP
jgi:murein DD-endopeptidase MepM/ murein hydrolase activator NlpD